MESKETISQFWDQEKQSNASEQRSAHLESYYRECFSFSFSFSFSFGFALNPRRIALKMKSTFENLTER